MKLLFIFMSVILRAFEYVCPITLTLHTLVDKVCKPYSQTPLYLVVYIKLEIPCSSKQLRLNSLS